MKTLDDAGSPETQVLANGSGAAAVLSAGIGCFALAALAIAGNTSAVVKSGLNFYKATGPLSGVTTVAILVWLCTWGVLEWRWGKKTVALGRVSLVSLLLLALGFLLTFPPIAELF